MDVTEGRKIDKVIILGSGMSILDLNEKEIEYINKCKTVIAVNKFMAFYKKSKILPTHVYFHDDSWNNKKFFQCILDVCIKDKLDNLTFITNKRFGLLKKRSALSNMFSLFKYFIKYRLRLIVKMIVQNGLDDYHLGILSQKNTMLNFPSKCRVDEVDISLWTKGGDWSQNLKSPLFHFRGSLSSVLNYASICFPNQEIYLVGNDFNGANYFYEDELNQLNFNWKDFTYSKTKKEKKHFSFQNVGGTKMSDKFPFIISSLMQSNNNLFCINENSLLVKEAGVKTKLLVSPN